MDIIVSDVAYVASDLMTGKAIPALAFLSTAPLDPHLMGTMVLTGCLAGSFLTLYQAWYPSKRHLLEWIMRLFHHLLSAYVSIQTLFVILFRMENAMEITTIIPTFCVISQYLPEKQGTPLILGLVTMAAFWASIAGEVFPTESVELVQRAEAVSVSHHSLSRSLLAMTRKEWRHKINHRPKPRSVVDSTVNSLWALILSFYASVQHGPVYPFEPQTVDKRYLSQTFLRNPLYASYIIVTTALLRAYIFLRVAWVQENPFHRIFDVDAPLPLTCAWFYTIALLYSAAWACTQMTEQVLTFFAGDRLDRRMRITILLMALSLATNGETPRWLALVGSIASVVSRVGY